MPARVVTVDRGRYTTLVGEGTGSERVVVAMKARELGRSGISVGDRVALVGDVGGGADSLARVVRVRPRTTVLRRTADDTDPVERVVVTNADQLVVVTSVTDPEPRPRLVDRALAAAYDAGIVPVLLLTKADLGDPTAFLDGYAALDLEMLSTARRGDGTLTGLDAVRDLLSGHESVLLGHSGVGKSTLVNALVPDADRATGAVNDVTGRGRHTSSSAVALRLREEGGAPCGWVVDTPGIRSFGLAHLEPQRLLAAFADLGPGSAACPRGCSHDEPECALDAYVAAGGAGRAGAARLDSYRRLLRARTDAT